MSSLTAVTSGPWTTLHTWGDADEECVANGGFDSDSGWTKGSGWSIAGGVAHDTSTNTLDQTPTGTKRIQSGRVYTTTFTVLNYSSGSVRIVIGGTAGTTRSANGTYTEDVTAGAGSTIAIDGVTGGSFDVDNVSVKLKTEEYPQAADTVTIPSDVTVTYDADSTDEIGNIAVNGTLTWDATKSTELRVAAGSTISGTGTINVGTSGTPIPAAYTAKIYLAASSNNTGGIVMTGSSAFNAYGDPAYYGSDFDTTLQANWTSGQTFTVVGNFSAKWKDGQKIHVHKNAAYSSYSSDVVEFTLNGAPSDATNSVCTIVESAPGVTFASGGYVLNTSRNVIIAKTSGARTLGTAEATAPRFTTITTNISAAELGNLYRPSIGTNAAISKSVVRNCQTANIHNATTPTIADCVFASGAIFANGAVRPDVSGSYCYAAPASALPGVTSPSFSSCKFFSNAASLVSATSNASFTTCSFNGNAASSFPTFYQAGGLTLTACDVFNSGAGSIFSLSSGDLINCFIYGNAVSTTNIFSGSTIRMVSGGLGYSRAGSSIPNQYEAIYTAPEKIRLLGVKNPLSGLAYNGRNTVANPFDVAVCIGDFGQTAGVHALHAAFATIESETTTVRTGGGAYSLKVTPLSALASPAYVKVLEWSEASVAASSQTRTVYIRGFGWSSWPTNTQLYLEAEYYPGADPTTARTTAVSTAVLTDNTTWVNFPVTFVPGHASYVVYRLYLKTYAATSGIYVDGALYNGATKKEIVWKDGEPVVDIDYSAWSSSSSVIVVED